jgi:hypothetical protein
MLQKHAFIQRGFRELSSQLRFMGGRETWVERSVATPIRTDRPIRFLRTHVVQYPDAPGDFRDGQH